MTCCSPNQSECLPSCNNVEDKHQLPDEETLTSLHYRKVLKQKRRTTIPKIYTDLVNGNNEVILEVRFAPFLALLLEMFNVTSRRGWLAQRPSRCRPWNSRRLVLRRKRWSISQTFEFPAKKSSLRKLNRATSHGEAILIMVVVVTALLILTMMKRMEGAALQLIPKQLIPDN